jgi:hypothetical protein
LNRTNFLATAFAVALLFPIELPAQVSANGPDLSTQSRIRQEGLRNSKVMELASGLTDTIGPRLTASPSMKRANEWTKQKLTDFGLVNAHLEPFEFGRGWTSEACSVRMIAPDVAQLYALPKAWSPGTNGPIRAKVMKVKLESEADLEKQKGKLAGAIIMLAEPKPLEPHEKAELDRYDDKELEDLAAYAIPSARDANRALEYVKRRKFRRALAQFTMDEKVAAVVDLGSGDGGTYRVQSGGSWKSGEPIGVPAVVLAPEHYGRLSRLIDGGTEVQLEIDVKAQFLEQDTNGYNTIAELPGGDKKSEIVMLGAHLDSWHSSTGATDNAAGVAVMMEAMRILKALNVTPRRTIRIALWSAEEQGLLGSRAYVAQHFASRPEPKDPDDRDLPLAMRKDKGTLTVKPEHAKLSAYFNVDNGTGKIRGIYAQENAAVVPLFRAWLEPLHDLGATTLTMRNTTGTDHLSFDEVGIPGFQFIQDEIEYETRTHHTNWDSYERLQRDDLMQAAVVVATFVWEAANRAEMMPRKAMPQ